MSIRLPGTEPQLPKGMEIPEEDRRVLSQQSRNYSGEILNALDAVEGLRITVEEMEVSESRGQIPVIRLVLLVGEKDA